MRKYLREGMAPGLAMGSSVREGMRVVRVVTSGMNSGPRPANKGSDPSTELKQAGKSCSKNEEGGRAFRSKRRQSARRSMMWIDRARSQTSRNLRIPSKGTPPPTPEGSSKATSLPGRLEVPSRPG